MERLRLSPGELSLEEVSRFYQSPMEIFLGKQAKKNCEKARKVVEKTLQHKKIIYGVNTGFGKFANKIIPQKKLIDLQYNLLRSHAVGVGPLLSEKMLNLIYLLKINALAQGYSGVRYQLIEQLILAYQAGVMPEVPSKGSVGASGDLAPLAHFSLPLIGEGRARVKGMLLSGQEALLQAGLSPLALQPKEGLSLINGLQVSCALATEATILIEHLWQAAIYAGALSTVAVGGLLEPFDERVIQLLRSPNALKVSKKLLKLIGKTKNSEHVQDPYSLRCQPQVMGACLDGMDHAKTILSRAINAISDNPIVDFSSGVILSGGNFHGQGLALIADSLATVVTTIGNFSERRIAMLMDPHFSQLPAFLVEKGGENSGLMMMQVTAAALASENKVFAHPASADSIPTSSNQEDHVSMSTFATRRLHEMIENAMSIVAIELIAACQAVDLQNDLTLSPALRVCHQKIREHVAFYEQDVVGTQHIEKIKIMIESNLFYPLTEISLQFLSPPL